MTEKKKKKPLIKFMSQKRYREMRKALKQLQKCCNEDAKFKPKDNEQWQKLADMMRELGLDID